MDRWCALLRTPSLLPGKCQVHETHSSNTYSSYLHIVKSIWCCDQQEEKKSWMGLHFTAGPMFCSPWNAPPVSCWSQHRMLFMEKRWGEKPVCSQSEFHARYPFSGKVNGGHLWWRCIIQHYTCIHRSCIVAPPPDCCVDACIKHRERNPVLLRVSHTSTQTLPVSRALICPQSLMISQMVTKLSLSCFSFTLLARKCFQKFCIWHTILVIIILFWLY